MNPTTRRYSRSLSQAFGPYETGPVYPMPEPRRRYWQDLAVYAIGLIAVSAIIFFAN